MPKINLIIIEGILIILLVLFSGFLAYQNQSLTKRIQELSVTTPTATPTFTPTPSPSESPSATPSATPRATGTPLPINTFAP